MGPDRYAGLIRPPSVRAPVASSVWRWDDADVHLLRLGRPDAPVRVVLLHGAGGNAAALRPVAEHVAALGVHVTVPDLPGYGRTRARDRRVRYGHWQRMTADLLRAEDDDRPLVLMGASMGGLLAYEAAEVTGLAAAVIATCLLDPRDAAVRARLTWHPLVGQVAGPALRLLAGPLASVRVPVRWVADMRHIANDPDVVRAVLGDPRGGGGRVPLGWMRSFLEVRLAVEPERARTPLVLTHPAEDRWTPVALSRRFLDRVAAPTEVVLLDRCGHFPVEDPGLGQLLAAVRRTVVAVAGRGVGGAAGDAWPEAAR